MFEGEDGLNEKEDGEDHSGSFLNANVWARISTVLAGPVFNFILGFIIAFIIFALTGLGIRYYIKGKGSCGDCECSCPVKEEMHKANH